MVFITTGQRIATENFADGVIYKVVFSDSSIAYMMCVGIGQDFVMLQGPNPSLFCLTMSSASRVSTIDIHDPTPPEPPTTLENVLQYQNGEPPFTFTTTTSKLFSWDIEGPCGDETANLFDEANLLEGYYGSTADTYTQLTSNSNFKSFTMQLEAGTYTASISCNEGIKLIRASNSIDGVNVVNINDTPYTFTLTGTASIYFSFRNLDSTSTFTNLKVMLNTGSMAQNYEPYGYKIPISCNSNKTTIYLDAPLGEGEKLYSVNIDTEITTDIGENTLTVDTTDTPTMQIVYDIYAEG